VESGRLWASISRHWLLWIVVFVLVLGAAVAAAFLPKPTYQATATFGLVPQQPTSSPTVAPQASLAQSLVGNYLAQIDSKTTETKIRALITGPEKTVAWTATGVNDPGTLVLRVQVSSQDSSVVASVANAYVRQFTNTTTAPPGVSVVQYDVARTPTAPVSPNKKLLLGAGLVLAVVLASAAALLAGDTPKGPRQQRGSRTGAPTQVPPVGYDVPTDGERTAEPIRG